MYCNHNNTKELEKIGDDTSYLICLDCNQVLFVRSQYDPGCGHDDIVLRPGEQERGYDFPISEYVRLIQAYALFDEEIGQMEEMTLSQIRKGWEKYRSLQEYHRILIKFEQVVPRVIIKSFGEGSVYVDGRLIASGIDFWVEKLLLNLCDYLGIPVKIENGVP